MFVKGYWSQYSGCPLTFENTVSCVEATKYAYKWHSLKIRAITRGIEQEDVGTEAKMREQLALGNKRVYQDSNICHLTEC